METGQKSSPRVLAGGELAPIIRSLREMHQWSQEALAAISGLSVRTVQTVERGESSDLHTRRALAGAFESEELDLFNKPYSIPTPEEMKQAQDAFEQAHFILDTAVTTNGRELALLFDGASMDWSNPGTELAEEAAIEFASLVDYLRDYRDCADDYTEVQKLDVFADLQRHLDALDAAGIAICYATRNTKLVGGNWEDKTPLPVKLVYLSAFEKGKVPTTMAVSKKIKIG